tara:strand:- start:6796 stop:7422 length:627 start_codon:yes stop_codon:yes gene_type:complete
VEKMGTLWQFFGFPDPESPAPESVKKRKKKKSLKKEEAPGQQLTLVSPDEEPTPDDLVAKDSQSEELEQPKLEIPPPVKKSISVPPGWTGLLTPDGEAFHDLSNYSSKATDFPDRALRYVVPDKMHRLPIRQIQDRILRGDTVIIDLNGLIHMDTQTNACRRTLKQMGDEIDIPIFALDESDKLLLMPGREVSMDVSRNDLGLVPLLI